MDCCFSTRKIGAIGGGQMKWTRWICRRIQEYYILCFHIDNNFHRGGHKQATTHWLYIESVEEVIKCHCKNWHENWPSLYHWYPWKSLAGISVVCKGHINGAYRIPRKKKWFCYCRYSLPFFSCCVTKSFPLVWCDWSQFNFVFRGPQRNRTSQEQCTRCHCEKDTWWIITLGLESSQASCRFMVAHPPVSVIYSDKGFMAEWKIQIRIDLIFYSRGIYRVLLLCADIGIHTNGNTYWTLLWNPFGGGLCDMTWHPNSIYSFLYDFPDMFASRTEDIKEKIR